MSPRKAGNRLLLKGGNSPCRILVVDDDEDIRHLNVTRLTDADY
jgi:hypothetical protein